MSPFNVKHGLVDPSHTMTHPDTHPTKRNIDFMNYTKKGPGEHNSRELQHLRRETTHFNGSMILRLPEKRDYFPELEGNPVGKYFET